MSGPDVIVIAESLDQERWQSWFDGLAKRVEAAVAPELIYDGRNRLVRLPGPDGADVVVKRFRLRRPQDRVLYLGRRGKAERSYRYAGELQARDIPTPAPLAYAECRSGPLVTRGWYVCEWCEHLATLHTLDRIPAERLPALFADLGRSVAAMHKAQIFHRDLTPGNLLVVDCGERFLFPVVDCNRMRFGPMSRQQVVTNLVQLDRDGEDLQAIVAAYTAATGADADQLLARCLRRQRRYRLKWAVKNATRPWRRRIGL